MGQTLRNVALLLIAVAATIAAVVFGLYAISDWNALQPAAARFEQTASTSAELPVLFIADAKQNIHRINLFAEGVWSLLCALIATVAIHGLATIKRPGRLTEDTGRAST